MGALYHSLGKYQKAINYQEKRLSIALRLGDRKGESAVYGNLGTVYLYLGKYQEAFKYQEKFLSIAVEIGDKNAESLAYGNLGAVYQSQGKYQKAIKYQEKCLNIAVEIGDKNGVSGAYRSLGITYHLLGKYKESMEYQKMCLGIAREIGDRKKESDAYGDLGAVCYSLGKYQEFIKYQEKRLCIALEIGDKNGEGLAFGHLGTIYHSLGKYQEAIKYQEKRLTITKETGEKIGESTAYGNLGVTFQSLGKYQEAIKYQVKHLNIAVEIDNKKGEGSAYGNLGTVHQSLGKHQEALKYHEKCLSIAVEIGDKNGESTAYGNLGSVYHAIGNYQEAIKYQEKLLSIAVDIGDKNGESTAYTNLGTTYLSLGKYEEAIKYQEMCLSIAINLGKKETEGTALHNLGSCYSDAARYYKNLFDEDNSHRCMSKSANYFIKALKCFEWLFDNLEGQDMMKISILDTFVITYQALVQVLIELQRSDEALLVSERGRARALRDLLVSQYSLNQECDSLSIVRNYDGIKALLQNGRFSIAFFALFNSYCALWRLAHEESLLLHLVHMENGNGFLDKTLEAAFGEMQVRTQVNCENRSLDIFEDDDGNFVRRDFAVRPLLLPVRRNNESQQSNSKQDNHRSRNFWSEDEEDGIDHLEILYKILVSPVQQGLTQEEIVIVPDGLLFKVPFAALRDPNTKLYLSDTKRVRLAPSLTTLKVLQESPADYHNKTGALIVGNPAVEKVMVKRKKKSFPRLPAAEREALELSTLMGVTPLIGDQATKQVLLLQTT